MTEDEREAENGTDPRRHTVAGWIVIWEIIGKYKKASARVYAEHDILYLPLSLEDVPEDSEDGLLLNRLSCHADSDGECWAVLT